MLLTKALSLRLQTDIPSFVENDKRMEFKYSSDATMASNSLKHKGGGDGGDGRGVE